MTNSLPTTTWPSTDAADPYIALEKLDDPTVDSWVRAQTARTVETFSHTPNADIHTRRLFEAMTA